MTIAYLIDSLAPGGGTERVLATKVNWLVEQPDIKVVVITLSEAVQPFFPLSPKATRITLPDSASSTTGYQAALIKLLNELRPDISVAVAGKSVETLPKIDIPGKKILEFHYTKNFLVNFVRGLHRIRFRRLHILKMEWLQWRLARTARKYDLFVGLTKKDVGLWGNPANMTYVHNPLSFRSERKSTCLSKKIIAVGSWTPAKGMDQLLEAFGMLARKYPEWSVDLYGSGQEEYLLRNIIAKYGMEDQVTLNNPCKDIAEKLVEASIYAFPSRSDGFGLVITEAMECGLPTVAMDCPCGPCEILSPETGIVVPDGDIAAFRASLKRLMDNPEERISMGKAAARDVARFYPASIMPKWLELFSELCRMPAR